MDLFHFNPDTVFSFLLTFMRLSVVVFMLPFYGATLIPNVVKASFCLVLAMALWPRLAFAGTALPASPWTIGIMFLGEALLGLLLDILVRLLFSAAQSAGSIMGFSMGFSLMNSIDPMTGASESGLGHLMSQVATMLFLCLNGHLFLLSAMAQSFEMVPPGGLLVNAAVGEHLIAFTGQMFVMAIKIAAPILASIFLVDLALALVARAAPQMNVLFIGFPLKVSVGFLFMTMVFAAMTIVIENFLIDLEPMFRLVLKASS